MLERIFIILDDTIFFLILLLDTLKLYKIYTSCIPYLYANRMEL